MARFRPRFTVRRLMVAVAIFGVLLSVHVWINRRHSDFRHNRDKHVRIALSEYEKEGRKTPKFNHHWEIAGKYARASLRPWLPVAPDPPEPE
jgi:hypothetical protein